MLNRFEVPVVAVVENMSSFRCGGCGEDHFPFGRGHLHSVLSSIVESGGCPNVPSFRLPIVTTDGEGESPLESESAQLDALAESLERSTTGREVVELPQLAWHERPHWPDKLYFFSRKTSHGTRTRHLSDREFKITPPNY
jgi:hypothetical protein